MANNNIRNEDPISRQMSFQKSQQTQIKIQKSKFLDRKQENLRTISVRLPDTLIDWIDNLASEGSKNKEKSRIPK